MSKIWEEYDYAENEIPSEDGYFMEEVEESEVTDEAEYMEYEDTDNKDSPNFAYELNKTEGDIMQNALVQLEQAKLYDMFLKHKLFDGIKAHPKALKNVEKELKDFILGRLQILLGIKKEDKEGTAQHVELPFNETEIEFLKALAYKGTKGQSQEDKPAFAPIKQAPKQTTPTLKSIKQEYKKPEVKVETKKETTPIPKKQPQQPPTKTKELARKLIKKSDKDKKSPFEMTKEEMKQLSSSLELGETPKRPANAIPLPDTATMMGYFLTEQANNTNNKTQEGALMGVLRQKLGNTNTNQDLK